MDMHVHLLRHLLSLAFEESLVSAHLWTLRDGHWSRGPILQRENTVHSGEVKMGACPAYSTVGMGKVNHVR